MRARRAEALAYWLTMKPEARSEAEAGLDNYIRCAGDFPVDMIRYLKHRRWEDEAGVATSSQAEIQQQMDLWNEMRMKYGRAAV